MLSFNQNFNRIKPESATKTKDPLKIANYSANWPSEGCIEFFNHSVKYRKNLPTVLRKITLRIKAHEKIGIVGRTGSGKSTIFLSILRILEADSGSIFIDGVKISELGLYDLRQKITIIPQDPILFKGTIRENLDMLNEFTDAEMWKVLEMVCIKEKFEQDKGLNSEVKLRYYVYLYKMIY